MYDIIISGARCAGASTALLLAKQGYRVLLVDRAAFPSDTLSTHIIHLKGGAVLADWGLYQKVMDTHCPPVREVQFHLGPDNIQGQFPALRGADAVLCPRRTVLDKILVDAAVAAGAELREDFLVEELLQEGDCVSGVRGRTVGQAGGAGQAVEEKARLVIGADGKRSLVAKSVQAPEYHVKPVQTCAYYTYWAGLDLKEGEMYSLEKTSVGLWPTNAGLAMIYTPYPIAEFPAIRRDIEGRFWGTVGRVPGLSERLRSGRQAERFYGTADLPAFYRRPYGPGWALVGDAGMTLDPITGHGISNAFNDAQRLAAAVGEFFSGRASFEAAMAAYEQARNADTLPYYEFTAQLASFAPPAPEQQILFSKLARQPEAASQFLGVMTGSVPFQTFFSPANLFRILGPTGMGKVLWANLKSRRRSSISSNGGKPVVNE